MKPFKKINKKMRLQTKSEACVLSFTQTFELHRLLRNGGLKNLDFRLKINNFSLKN